MQKNNDKRIRLKKKIRVKINGTPECPRLSVFRSNKFIYAQIIDDTTGKTLLSASDMKVLSGKKNDRSKEVGRLIGELCMKQNINKVVFDRNGFRYTGRVKTVADEARKAGLQF